MKKEKVKMGGSDNGISFCMDISGGAEVLNYGNMKIEDKEGKELRGEFRIIDENRFAIVVCDKDAKYPITIDPLSSTPNWTVESNQPEARFGISVSTAGDVNGDRYSDVIVGAFYYDNGEAYEGSAFVYYGNEGRSKVVNLKQLRNRFHNTNSSFSFNIFRELILYVYKSFLNLW